MSDRIIQLEMDLLFAIILLLLDDDAEPYHTSILDAKARYEEILNHENDHFHMDTIRMDKITFLNLLDFLKIHGGLEDSHHVQAGQKLMVYLKLHSAIMLFKMTGPPCKPDTAFLIFIQKNRKLII